MSPEFQAQLAQAQQAASEQRAKTELQEQLQFAHENMPDVVIEATDELPTEFVNVGYSNESVGVLLA